MFTHPGADTSRYFVVSLGEIILYWGFIDALTAALCSLLFEQLGGHPSEKSPPVTLGRRLRYIGKCFRNNPKLSSLAELAEAICGEIRELAKHRDFIVHGCITEYVLNLPVPTIQYTKMDRKPDHTGYEQTSTRFTELELVKISHAAFQVYLRLTELGDATRKFLPPEKGSK